MKKSSMEHIYQDGIIIFRLAGEFTSFILDRLKKEIATQVVDKDVYTVLINLDGVEYINSKDLGVFVQIYHYLEGARKDNNPGADSILALTNLSSFVLDILEMTKLTTVFNLYDTEEEAIKALAANTVSAEDS